MKKLFLLSLTLLFGFSAISQWNQQTSGTSSTLTEVYFSSQDTGYVVGMNTILKTLDGGTTWQNVYSGNCDLEGIYFSSSNNGFAVGLDFVTNKSIVISTTNAGSNWSMQYLNANTYLYDIYFVNSTTGFIVGEQGLAYKTTDGGSTWNTLNTGTSERLESVYFTDPLTGFMVGGSATPTLLKTTDGGTNWSVITTPATDMLQGVFFPSSLIGYAVGWSGEIIKTTDGGNNWIAQTGVAAYGNLDVFFVSDNIGYVVGGGQSTAGILKTTDGGQNWTTQTTTVNQGLIGVYFPTLNTGYCVGASGTILKLVDNNPAGIENQNNSLQLTTYPNPFSDKLTVSFLNEGFNQKTIRILDIGGKIVYQSSNYIANQIIDLSDLTTGVYLLIAEFDNNRVIRKIVKD